MTIASTPAERFARIMETMCELIAASSKGGAVPGWLVALLWQRTRRIAARFAFLAARLRVSEPMRVVAASLPVVLAETAESGGAVEPDGAAPPPPRASGPSVSAAGRADRLPDWLWRRAGWLAVLAPGTAVCGSLLQHLLTDPEMAAMAAASPEIARILRSLFHMFRVDPRPYLPPIPPRRRPARPPPPPAAPVVLIRPIYPSRKGYALHWVPAPKPKRVRQRTRGGCSWGLIW